jgi:hypothetical protein
MSCTGFSPRTKKKLLDNIIAMPKKKEPQVDDTIAMPKSKAAKAHLKSEVYDKSPAKYQQKQKALKWVPPLCYNFPSPTELI